MKTWFFLSIAAGAAAVSSIAWAAPGASAQARLSVQEREGVRVALQTLVDGEELLVANRVVDQKDIEKQKRDFEAMRVYERFPLEPKLNELKEEMSAGSGRLGLKILSLTRVGSSKKVASLPAWVHSDNRVFKLTPKQVAEPIRLKIRIEGSREALDTWTGSWRDAQVRWVELEAVNAIAKKHEPRWEVRAITYRFRPIEFPKIRVRDPVELLPKHAQKNLDAFAKAEPLLWKTVLRGQELRTQAEAFGNDRRPYLLERARFEFYLQRTLKGSS